jgi:uncharacterized surface protein with fasciclin (FAS1) repeats
MTSIDPQRRTLLKAVSGTAALFSLGGVGLAGAKPGAGPKADAGRTKGARGETTLVDVAVENDFSILVAAVQKAGLVDALSGRRQLTVFAPTNQAFLNLLAATPYDSLEDIPVETLRAILLYHVTPGRRYADSVLNAPQVPTLSGASIAVDGTELNDGQADIVATDVEAANGVVHVIDGVLLP